jgi:hypothetical protein
MFIMFRDRILLWWWNTGGWDGWDVKHLWGVVKCVHNLSRKSWREESAGRPSQIWEGSIKINLKGTVCVRLLSGFRVELSVRILGTLQRTHKFHNNNTNKQQTPWPESASELYRPSDRRLSPKLVPTLADRGCRVVSATNHPQSLISVF